MKSKILTALSLFVLLLTGCNSSSVGTNKFNLYSDASSVTNSNITISFSKLMESRYSDEYNVSFEMSLLSTNPKRTTLSVDTPIVIRESNGAEYSPSAGMFIYKEIVLECDIKEAITFSFDSPTSIKDDRYYFLFKYNSKEVYYHLYEKPDSLRSKYEVKVVVDGEQKETKQMLEGKPLDNYTWTDNDYIYGCYEWYTDAECTNKIDESFLIMDSITIYGKKQTVLVYSVPSATSSSFVKDYNFIPKSGEIVVPKLLDGRSIFAILASSFSGACKGLKAIYIPRTVRISTYNFSDCVDLEHVYFEGNEEEWASLNEASYPSKTIITFNTYK